MNACERCGGLTFNPEDDYCEFVCDECLDNAAERAWERHCTNYDAPSLREQQIAALKFK
jgi:hypothetical protein